MVINCDGGEYAAVCCPGCIESILRALGAVSKEDAHACNQLRAGNVEHAFARSRACHYRTLDVHWLPLQWRQLADWLTRITSELGLIRSCSRPSHFFWVTVRNFEATETGRCSPCRVVPDVTNAILYRSQELRLVWKTTP